MKRYYALSTYFQQRFRRQVRKVPLDAGFDCPNRDGFLSRKGCVFCNPLGSGTGLFAKGMDLKEQWAYWREQFLRQVPPNKTPPLFLAYLQSFSNTYGPVEKLGQALDALFKGKGRMPLTGLAGLAIGTRPDCLEDDKIRLLASQPTNELWLEIGLQSASDSVLERINRGHTVAQFQDAVERVHALAEGRIKICVHVIAGLPGEELEDVVKTVAFIDTLPIHGVKFHNLIVAKGSGLAHLWEIGEYDPPGMDEYISVIIRSLNILRPDVVVQRLGSDPSGDELLAPDWAKNKRRMLNRLDNLLAEWNGWQGKERPEAGMEPPPWFQKDGELPPSLVPASTSV